MLDVNRNNLVSIAITAVLAFYLMFPVSGFQKPEKAEAVVPVAAVAVLGTALTAAGVYIAGTTLTQYDANLQAVYDGFSGATSQWSSSWTQYVNDQGSFDNALQSAVTADGNISLQTLYDQGLFDSLDSYSAYCVDNGTMYAGQNSLLPTASSYNLGGVTVPVISGPPSEQGAGVAQFNEYIANGYHYALSYDSNYGFSSLFVTDSAYTRINDDSVTVSGGSYRVCTVHSNGSVSTSRERQEKTLSAVTSIAAGQDVLVYIGADNPTLIENGHESVDAPVDGLASVDDSVDISQVIADSVSSGIVEVFSPTAETLAAGFSAVDVISANVSNIDATTSDIYGFLTGTLASALSPITGIAANVQTIRDTITTFPAWIENISDVVTGFPDTLTGIADSITTLPQAVTDWISGLFEGVPAWIQTIHDTVIGLPDAIGGVASGVVSGVQGWWESLLQWLGDTPLAALIGSIISAISSGVASLSDVISAIQAWIAEGVGELVGAIEGIGEMLPWGSVYEPLEGEPVRVPALPPEGYDSNIDAMLHEKEPFCYFFGFVDALNGVDYSQNTSFRVQHTFTVFGINIPVDINAEPYLNRDLGGTTMAYLLRMATTMVLVMGIVYGAYKTAIRTIKGA